MISESINRSIVFNRSGRSCRTSRRPAGRRGFVIVAVIVVFVISTVLFGTWTRSVVRQHQMAVDHEMRLQATRLAEAGLRRGMAQRASNASYEGDVWSIPVEVLGASRAAEVRIHVVTDEATDSLLIEAVADYPAGATRRARVSRKIKLPNETPGDES